MSSTTKNIVKDELKLSSFEHNLLKLSINTSIDGALLEWNNIYKEKRDEKSGLCICQHKIGRSSAGMAMPSPKYLFYV